MVNDAKWMWTIAKCRVLQGSNLVIQSHAPEDFNHIQSLSDELLVEILCRLPCSKSATRSKCVCKRWDSLISHPYFIGRFIACKVGGGFPCIDNRASSCKRAIMIPEEKCAGIRADSDYENCTSRFEGTNKGLQAFATVSRITRPCNTLEGLMMCLEDPIFDPKSLSFSSLASFEDGNLTHIIVVGACNDLVLFCKSDKSKYYYYIRNVQTKKWLVLPTHGFYHSFDFVIGFICDPYYNYDYEGKITLNSVCRYTIVVVPYDKSCGTKFSALMLSSKTSSQWRKRDLSLPRHCQLYLQYPGFGFAGMLHFICVEGIIGFDPYDDHDSADGVIQCHFIRWPLGFVFKMVRVGVCQGCLHLSDYLDGERLVIWVLKDYKAGEWCLKHNIGIQDWITMDPPVATHLSKSSFPGYLTGFHETNSDVIYLRLASGEIVFCDLPRRTLEIVSQDLRVDLYCRYVWVQIKIPIWPTPLPTLL